MTSLAAAEFFIYRNAQTMSRFYREAEARTASHKLASHVEGTWREARSLA
jgi:hypothetical protein